MERSGIRGELYTIPDYGVQRLHPGCDIHYLDPAASQASAPRPAT
jgi:hypothetical protein